MCIKFVYSPIDVHSASYCTSWSVNKSCYCSLIRQFKYVVINLQILTNEEKVISRIYLRVLTDFSEISLHLITVLYLCDVTYSILFSFVL